MDTVSIFVSLGHTSWRNCIIYSVMVLQRCKEVVEEGDEATYLVRMNDTV